MQMMLRLKSAVYPAQDELTQKINFKKEKSYDLSYIF